MRTARKLSFILLGAVLAGCNSSSSSEWREVKTSSYESRFERAKAICNGRAAQTQVIAGRLWIAGAIAANSSLTPVWRNKGSRPSDLGARRIAPEDQHPLTRAALDYLVERIPLCCLFIDEGLHALEAV